MTDLFEAPETNEASLRSELEAKWKDKPLEEVLKAKVDSDLYIKTLERQKDELRTDYLKQREELLAKAKFEDLLTKLQDEKNNSGTPPIVKEEESREPIDIDKKIREALAENRLLERQTNNATMVQNKLKERFGNSYQDVLRDTGLSTKQINEIAAESPEAIYRLVGMDSTSKESFQTPPRSSQRNDSFAPKGQPKRDWNYYQELKKTNPKLYLDPKLSVQMHNDAIEQGDTFYG